MDPVEEYMSRTSKKIPSPIEVGGNEPFQNNNTAVKPFTVANTNPTTNTQPGTNSQLGTNSQQKPIMTTQPITTQPTTTQPTIT